MTRYNVIKPKEKITRYNVIKLKEKNYKLDITL